MGSSDPPYMYDRPNRPTTLPYSQFDPKAVSRASWQQSTTSSRPTSPQKGPLLDFNRHPDSYMVIRGSQRDVPSMPSNTKRAVTAVRWTQFALRLLQFFAAMGALFCAIVLKAPEQVEAWIMRCTPAYDLLIGLYALYHLLRSSKHRTPASSASYHVFALIMDVGLVSLYAFVAYFGNFASVAVTGDGSWGSLFPATGTTSLLVLLNFCLACSLGGLHLISMGLGLYLIVIFRKISNLPPDMNPLEDNLTSRKSSKHKHKNSELSLGAEKIVAQDNVFAVPSPYQNNTPRMSRNNLADSRQVPFGHSRGPSDLAFSPHNPRSAQISREDLARGRMYEQQRARQSVQSLAGAQSFVTAHSSITNLPGHFVQQMVEKRKSAQSPVKDAKALVNDNWYVVNDDVGESRLDAMSEVTYDGREPRLPEVGEEKENEGFTHEPLRMNPPSPSGVRPALGDVSINRSGTVISNATVTSSVYSESAPSMAPSPPKSRSKFYGDLSAATRGIRGYARVPQNENVPAIPERSPDRVVSRSGADIGEQSIMLDKNSKRRLFSGKRAEEGMAGFWR